MPKLQTEKELKAYLDRQSELYYNEGEPEISDREFDILMRKYEKMTGSTYDTTTEPPVDTRFTTTEHSFGHLTGRTRKAYDVSEVKEWLEETNPTNQTRLLLITDKYDGNSGTAEFDSKGNLIKFLTRGKDGKGLNLTPIFADRKVPKKVISKMKDRLGFTHPEDTFALKVEMLIGYQDFNLINKTSEDKKYSNPRNLVAGILRSNEAKDLQRFIKFAPLRTDAKIASYKRTDDWSFIQDNFVDVDDLGTISNMEYKLISGTNEELVKEIDKYYQELVNGEREKRPYMIDGLVLEYVEENIREDLGRINDTNKFDIALKFPNMTKPSVIKDIEFYQGKTGRITPVAVFEPVYFNGAKCDHVSLSNYDRFKKLDLHVGSHVIIEYHGDVLSYLIRDDSQPDTPDMKEIPFITTCPKCGEELVTNANETFVSCENPVCPSNVVGRLTNWTTKMGLKGINSATLEKLAETGLVQDIPDLYKLNLEDAKQAGVFRDKGAEVYRKALAMKPEAFDYEVLGSLMFTSLGRGKMKEICKYFSYDELVSMSDTTLREKLSNLAGVGEISANYFLAGRQFNKTILEELPNYITIKNYKDSLQTTTEPMKIVFTGFRDKDLKERLELAGHKVTGKTSSKTNVVIAADPTGSSSSIKLAKEKGIPVMTVDEFKTTYNFD